MEGFDSKDDGSPGELTIRRYKRYAEGGSGIIWFEATSILHDGRSNPHQLLLNSDTVDEFKSLVDITRDSAIKSLGQNHNPFLVLQLTHSGRFSKPLAKSLNKIFYRNPWLDINDDKKDLFTDEEIDSIKESYLKAIEIARAAGFDAVDIKACHGYLLHEMLSSYNREDSKYGGSFQNRIRLLKELCEHNTDILTAVRLNVTDLIAYPFGFGMNADGAFEIDLSETRELIENLIELNCTLLNITAGVPRYNPHVGRPFDRSLKGSLVPYEHPLEGVARLIELGSELQSMYNKLPIVGTGYSWLRHFYPYIAAGVLKNNMASFIGLGRNSFAYPDAPKDLMLKGKLDPEKACISCSRCTEFMRHGFSTGCAIHDKEIYGEAYKNIKFKK